jgi:flagella basal body P-ring formation protein FlgA
MSRRCRLLLAALGLAGLLGPLGAGASAAVYLHASVNLASTACTLGELAAIASDVPALQERLARVEVARPQGPALISAEQLRRSITEQYGGGVDLIGSRVAVIPRGAVPEGQEWFFLALLAFLDRLDQGSGGMELELLSRPALGSEPAPVEFSLGPNPGATVRLAGRVRISYRVTGAGGEERGGLLLWVHSFQFVARAARDLPRGRLLEAGDVEYAQVDISQLYARFLTASELSGAWRTLAPIAKGQLLEPARLSREYWVKAGEAVTVVFLRPGFSVTLQGKALGSGGQDEPVEVRLQGSARRFRGRISGVGEVLVEQL